MSEETVVLDPTKNAALAEYDISNYKGVSGKNFYNQDSVLKRIINRYSGAYTPAHKQAVVNHLQGYGELVGGILDELTEACHKEGKYGEIVQYDRTGKRIDEIRYSSEQQDSRRISYEYGIVNLDHHEDWNFPFTQMHRMALAYLANMNGEGGVTCPLAMTDGLIRILKAIGTPEQQEKYLPMIAGEDSESHFMCGQYVTERVGGSNVGANRTIAEKTEDGRWVLNGEKWFCSNPGDLWVTTARIKGTKTIGLFLAARLKDDGTLNGCHHLRKKDIIGSRGKITVEVVYQDLEVTELGRPTHGLANLIKYVINTSRVHVAVSAVGTGRRAYMEALAYVQAREAYNQKVGEYASVRRTLAEMQIRQTALALTCFRNFMLAEEGHKASGLLTPVLKYISTTHSTWITHEAMMLHGGNGIIGDFSCLPRLHNDSVINETWEGTHQIISEHALKAFSRPKIRAAFDDLIHDNLTSASDVPALNGAVESLREIRARFESMLGYGADWQEMNRLLLCKQIYNIYALSEFISEAVLDHHEGKTESIMISFARAFGELAEHGDNIQPDGIFFEPEVLKGIIQY